MEEVLHFARILKVFEKVLCKYRSERSVAEGQPPAAIPKLNTRIRNHIKINPTFCGSAPTPDV